MSEYVEAYDTWINAAECNPESSGSYLVYSTAGTVSTSHYYKEGERWSPNKKVLYWRCMPSPPNDTSSDIMLNNPQVIAVDFDGTIVESAFPDIGKPIYKMIRAIKRMKEKGKEIILYTNREGQLLDDALAFCDKHGLVFDAVNQNLQWRTELYGNDCRKIGADIYIDDKAINPKYNPELLKYLSDKE